MKVFHGFPDHSVVVVDGGGPRILEPPTKDSRFAWGNALMDGPGATQLAKAIMLELVDAAQATAIYMRFRDRFIRHLIPAQGWVRGEDELMAIVAAILKVDAEDVTRQRSIVSREVAPVVNEGGGGIGRSPQDQGPRDIEVK